MREWPDASCVEIDNALTEGGQLMLEYSPPRSWSQPLEPVGSLFSLQMRCKESGRRFSVKFRKTRAPDRPYFIEAVSRIDEPRSDQVATSPTRSVTLDFLDWSNLRSCPFCSFAPPTKSFVRSSYPPLSEESDLMERRAS